MESLFRTNDPQEAHRYFTAKANFSTGPGELQTALEHGRRVGVDFTLIDVRSAEEYSKGHLPGAVNLPEERWSTFAGLANDKLNLIYCATVQCHLAARAGVEFTGAGYSVMEVDGGIAAWKAHGFAIETIPVGGLKRVTPPPFRGPHENDGRFANESIL